jgi:hypothetical protein
MGILNLSECSICNGDHEITRCPSASGKCYGCFLDTNTCVKSADGFCILKKGLNGIMFCFTCGLPFENHFTLAEGGLTPTKGNSHSNCDSVARDFMMPLIWYNRRSKRDWPVTCQKFNLNERISDVEYRQWLYSNHSSRIPNLLLVVAFLKNIEI